jgi:hypothetical protein
MDQFEAGQPWDVVPGMTLDGGHDVPMVDYDNKYVYVVTWGALQPVTYAFLAAKYGNGTPVLEEAHVELDKEWLAKNGNSPAGFNWQSLVAALTDIPNNQPVPTPTPPIPTPTPLTPPNPTPTPPTPAMSNDEFCKLMEMAARADRRKPGQTVAESAADFESIIKRAQG